MLCRCPACRQAMEVQSEQIDFLVRCDHCRAMFIARSAVSVEFVRQAAARIQADAARSSSREEKSLETTGEESRDEDAVLAEVARVAREEHRAEQARAALHATPRQKELQRFELRWRRHALGIISLCGFLGVVLLSGVVFVLNTLRPANASANPSSITTPESAKPAEKAQEKESSPAPTGTGELFPDIKGSD